MTYNTQLAHDLNMLGKVNVLNCFKDGGGYDGGRSSPVYLISLGFSVEVAFQISVLTKTLKWKKYVIHSIYIQRFTHLLTFSNKMDSYLQLKPENVIFRYLGHFAK